jgi:hypothetical protein
MYWRYARCVCGARLRACMSSIMCTNRHSIYRTVSDARCDKRRDLPAPLAPASRCRTYLSHSPQNGRGCRCRQICFSALDRCLDRIRRCLAGSVQTFADAGEAESLAAPLQHEARDSAQRHAPAIEAVRRRYDPWPFRRSQQFPLRQGSQVVERHSLSPKNHYPVSVHRSSHAASSDRHRNPAMAPPGPEPNAPAAPSTIASSRPQLCRMHVMELRQLRQRLLTLERSQGHLGLECRTMVAP